MIYLCALNSQYIHSNPAVYCLKSAIDKYSSQYSVELPAVSVIEYTVNDAYDTVFSDIVGKKPGVICFSVYIWNVPFVKKLLSDIRKALPDTKIVLGGPEVSYGTDDFPEGSFDHVIEGEGETRLFSLLCRIYGVNAAVDTDSYIPGDEIPFPYDDGNIGLFKNRIVYYESTRGCPFTCAYCLSGNREPVRARSIGEVKKHIDFFVRHEVPLVKFVDRTFNYDRERTSSILTYIISKAAGKNMTFHFECAADLFREEHFDIIRTAPAGLLRFEIGIQSTMDEALNAACRKTDTARVLENIKKITGYKNCVVHADLIAGLPHESFERFKESFNAVQDLGCAEVQLGFLKLLKGAPLNRSIAEYGYVFSSNPPYQIISSKWITADELCRIKPVEDVYNRYSNSGLFRHSVSYLTSFYDSPWDFYEDLSLYFSENGLIGKGVARRNLFTLLSVFSEHFSSKKDIIDQVQMKKNLLFDFYSSDSSEVMPEALRSIHVPEKVLRNRDREKIYAPAPCGVRSVDGRTYLFDYSRRDPVSGTYPSQETVSL